MLKRNIILIFVFLVMGNFFISCKKDKPLVVKTISIDPEPIDTILKCNGFSELCNKRLDEVTTLMTHNSFNNAQKSFIAPNQDFSITKQLSDGVRGLMLDVYSSPNGPVLYHAFPQLGKEPLLSGMRDIKNFLLANPNEVITIIFENHCTHEELLQVMDTLEMRDMIYLHNGTWPTLEEMIKINKRLVLMVEFKNDVILEGLLYAWQHTFDSRYDFKNVDEMDCSINRGSTGLKTFYLLNHWVSGNLGLPDKSRAKKTNSWEVLGERTKNCTQEQQHKINFLGVDFYDLGDAMSIVDSLNGVKR